MTRCIYCTSAISTFERSALKQVDLFNYDRWEQWQLSGDSQGAVSCSTNDDFPERDLTRSEHSVYPQSLGFSGLLFAYSCLCKWHGGEQAAVRNNINRLLKCNFLVLIDLCKSRKEKHELIQIAQQLASVIFAPCLNKWLHEDHLQVCPGQGLLFASQQKSETAIAAVAWCRLRKHRCFSCSASSQSSSGDFTAVKTVMVWLL